MPDKHYQPTLLVTSPRTVLVVGVVVSVLLHAAAGVWAWDKVVVEGPLPGAEPIAPFSVKRSAEVYIPVTLDRDPAQGMDQGPSAAELSQRLLDEQPPPLVADPLDLDVELRPIEEPFEGMTGGLEIDLPAFELNDDVLSSLDTRPPAELDFGDAPGTGNDTGDGTGPNGSGTIAGNALGGTDAAPRRTGVTGGGQALVDRPVLDRPGGVNEVMPDLNPSLEAPPIDFVDLALADTTEIVVPENLDNDFAYRVTRFTPTDRRGNAIDPAIEPGYFRVDITAQRSLRKLATMPKDVIFIIDTSSSVPQRWVDEIMAGVKASFVTFNENDRFNIVLFNEKVSIFAPGGAVPATQDNFTRAGTFLDGAESVGYTDVNAAMRGLLVRDIDPQRVYDLVLISDGLSTRGVVDTRELINLITRDNDLAAGIYCVGVAREQNRELLNFLSYRNKGFSVYADEDDEAARVIQDLMSRLRFPIIKDMRLDIAGLADDQVFPVNLPDIHQGQTVSVFGRFDQPDDFTMQITGRSAGQDTQFTFTRDLRFADVGDENVATGWAFWKLHDLYSVIIREGEQPELLQQVEDIRRKYGLKTLY